MSEATVVALDPRIKARLDAAPPAPPYDELPVQAVRDIVNARINAAPKLNEAVARVEDRQIAGPAGAIPVRIYTPEGHAPFPVLVYLHGGGWVLGSIDTHDDYCRSLCHRGGAVVVSVGYRLAPEHKFPVPLEDCYAALKWCAEQASEIGGSAEMLAIAGDSAGGNLCAAAALMARDKREPKVALQVLICPATNNDFNTDSYREIAAGYGLTRDAMMWFWKSYVGGTGAETNPYAAPFCSTNLAGSPRTLVITAQYDPLRDDGFAYAERLRQAAVRVRLVNYPDVNHGFVLWGAESRSAQMALDEIGAELRALAGHLSTT